MKLDGFESVRRAFAAAPERFRYHSSIAVGFSALRIANAARRLVPVDTGTLQRSIDTQHAHGQLTAWVGVSDPGYYWRFVEFGTQRTAARPFFRPAAEQETSHFVAEMRDVARSVEDDLAVR